MHRWLLLFLVVLLIAPCAWPQANTGSISGTVRDQSGGVIPSIPVVLVNTATGVTSNGKTNDVGFFLFPGLITGPYRLSVEAPGMQKYEGSMTLQIEQSLVLDPVLKPGSTTTTVEVLDVTPMVTTSNAIIHTSMERARIDQLPLNGRLISTLVGFMPGAEGMRVFGMQGDTQEYIVDGAVSQDRRWSMSLWSQTLGIGAIQEFTIDTGALSAKHSRPSNVIISTRSGTNQIHGSLYESHRNSGLGVARARTDTWTKPPYLNRAEFGINGGGPVYIPKVYNGKNRSFWFLNYEGRKQVNYSAPTFNLPTEAMRKGDFSGLLDSQGRLYTLYDPLTTNSTTFARQPFSYGGKLNAIDPARMSPTTKYLFSVTPLPTRPEINPLLDTNWWGQTVNNAPVTSITGRVDHRFSDRDSFFVRFHRVTRPLVQLNQSEVSPMALDGVSGWRLVLDGERAASTSWMHTFSPTFFNEALLSVRNRYGGGFTGKTVEMKEDWFSKLGLPNPFAVKDWPQFRSLGLGNYMMTGTGTDRAIETYYVLDDNLTRIVGKHELMFGGHYRKDQMNILPSNRQASSFTPNTSATALYDPNSTPNSPLAVTRTGYDIANLYLGVMTYSNSLFRTWYYLRSGENALYFQDNFKVTPRLTLNLGLRWERWPAYHEKYNLMVGFDPTNKAMVLSTPLDEMFRRGASVPSVVSTYQSLGVKFESWQDARLPRDLVNNRNRNFGPRLGFAYRALDGKKSFVIRGGYSLSYYNITQDPFISNFNNNTPLAATFNYLPNDTSQSPDGKPLYGLRSVPTVIMGVNSQNVINLAQPRGLTRGTASASYFDTDMPDSRTHQFNLTLEKEVAASTVARAGFVANHTNNISEWFSYNQSTPDFVYYSTTGLAKPGGEFANVALRPYDQQVFGTVQVYKQTAWAQANGLDFELERRFNKGYAYQLSMVIMQAMTATGSMTTLNQYMPGAVPADYNERNRFLNYRRDTGIPPYRFRYNWLMDLPFGKGKLLGGNASGVLDKFIGGWQLAGVGSYRGNYWSLPTGNWNITGEPIQQYGYKYPIEDCRTGTCIPGYLWWNGYIPSNQINSKDANGKPNGYMGIPANYKPAVTPLIPYGSTTMPPNAPAGTNIQTFWESNTVWIPAQSGTPFRMTSPGSLHPWRNQVVNGGVRQWGLDATLSKGFLIRERFSVKFLADFFNVFNHPGNPNSIGGDGFLNCRSSGQSARLMQLSLKFDF